MIIVFVVYLVAALVVAGLTGLLLLPLILRLLCMVSISLTPPPSPSPSQSFLIPAFTSHSRLLPTLSRNSFTYPLLYVGVDIDFLSSGLLNLPYRVFTYGSRWSLLSLRSENYLPGQGDLRGKVEMLLKQAGVKEVEEGGEGIGKVWMITMPACLGYEGSNPVNMWFVYRKVDKDGVGEERKEQREDVKSARGPLMCLVLEGDNLNGEKNAFVLPVDSPYAHTPTEGYDHSWTFPRTFHISLFNSRDGFYTLDLLDPFPSSSLPLSPPRLKVFIRVRTHDMQVKLNAVIAPSATNPPIPLHPSNWWRVFVTLGKYPGALFLTYLRTMYQARRLHYEKRLAAYTRCEPFETSKGAREMDMSWNKPEYDPVGVGFVLQRNPRNGFEVMAERVVCEWVPKQAEDVGVDLVVYLNGKVVVSTVVEGLKRPQVEMRTSDPRFFVHLLAAPSVDHYLLLAPEYQTTISSLAHFQTFFSPSDHDIASLCPIHIHFHSLLPPLIKRLRIIHMRWLFTHSRRSPPPHLLHPSASQPIDTHAPWRILVALIGVAFADRMEEFIMRSIRSVAVNDRDAWRIWERALARVAGEKPTALDSDGSTRY